jgi:hypothetical protein
MESGYGLRIKHFRSSGFDISAIPGTRSRALDIGSLEVAKCDTPLENGCDHGGHNRIDRNFGNSAFQNLGDRKVEELDARVHEIVKPKIPFSGKGCGRVRRPCAGGVFGKGPMYRVHWVSVKAERTILVLRI